MHLLKSFLKRKRLNSQKNPCRRIEILFEKKLSQEKTFTRNFDQSIAKLFLLRGLIMKYLSSNKISEKYNESSIKEMFLKISQYSQKNTCVGVSF